MSQCSTSAPWADTMEDMEERGRGAGEGCPPGSDTWTVYDWDRHDLLTLIHEYIMITYSMISYTQIAERVVRNRQAHEAVIKLLQEQLDNLEQLRENVKVGQLF